MAIFTKYIRRFSAFYLFASLTLLLAAGCFLALDIWFEYSGVPGGVMERISKQLRSRGLHFRAASCKAGFLKGIVFEDVEISGPNSYEYPALHAEKLRFSAAPWRIFSGTLLPARIRVAGGRLELPLLPESGMEGETDRIVITDLNADIGGDPGMIVIPRAKGKIRDFEFTVSGTVDNLLHLAGAHVSELLHDRLMEKESSAAVPAAAPVPHPSAGWYRRMLAGVPLSLRKSAIRLLDKFGERSFDGVPSVTACLSLDARDFNRTSAEALVFFPDFQYGHLRIGAIREKLVLKNGILLFKDLRLELGDGEYLLAQGHYDSGLNSVSGTFSGSCSPDKMLLFVSESVRETMAGKLDLSSAKRISFNGILHQFSLSSGACSGTAELRIPAMVFNGIRLKNVAAATEIGDDLISGRIVSSDPGGNEIKSLFTISGNTFKAAIEGKTPPAALRRFLSRSAADFIYGNVKFRNPSDRLHFSGEVVSPDWRTSEFEGKIRLTLPPVTCHGVALANAAAEMSFTANTLAVNGIEAQIEDSLRLSGNMKCLLDERFVSASLVCRGSPGKTIRMLEPRLRAFIESLTSGIQWPAQGNLVETSADIRIHYGDRPAYYITGSLVMTDFKYRGIHFNYGATRFLIDSDRLLVLPGALLQTDDGQALVSVFYKSAPPRKNVPGVRLRHGGILNFSFDSTMAGNDIMRCLYPDWRSEFIDFPDRMKVAASGVIDYGNVMNTRFSAGISNGKCFWKGIRISDVDSSVKYERNKLFIQNAAATVCGGRIGMDYEFDFNTKTGRIDAKLRSAHLPEILGELHVGVSDPARMEALVTAGMNAELYYNAFNQLQMNGAADLQVKGDDLWSVPVLGDLLKILGKAWNTSSLGSITELDGSFRLREGELFTDSLKSDGGVVALNANGSYYWNTNEFDFRVRAELLKGTLPFGTLSTVLSPISWILERRIHGRLGAGTYSWQ